LSNREISIKIAYDLVMDLPATLKDLIASGYQPKSVKAEIRQNVLERLAAGKPIVEGIIGYEDSVIPQLERALVIGHDLILLGERGQGKTRIIRALNGLLDPSVPAVAGSPLNEDPLNPILQSTKALLAERGGNTPIAWLSPAQRFGEKLATPDTTIADLIDEVDPIKVAEGRHLDDPETVTYGLVPTSNRGIFAINELPDLPERIQVGLLNALEERDIQVRGHKLRLELDILFVASANPEDYTSRGRLITPLKDRFGTQIRTHYPTTVDHEVAIMRQEASLAGLGVHVPRLVEQVIAQMAQLARKHPAISNYSGVSVRASIAALETAAAAALVRDTRNGEGTPSSRITDVEAAIPAFTGKIELDTLESGEEERIMKGILTKAVEQVFKSRHGNANFDQIVEEVSEQPITLDDDCRTTSFVEIMKRYPAINDAVGTPDLEDLSAEVELVLEGLVAAKRLSRMSRTKGAVYGGYNAK
jgi:magnesium chelatase subunit I